MAKGWTDIVDDAFAEEEKTVRVAIPLPQRGSLRDGELAGHPESMARRPGLQRPRSNVVEPRPQAGPPDASRRRRPSPNHGSPPPLEVDAQQEKDADDGAASDPVLAAIEELDGPAAALRASSTRRTQPAAHLRHPGLRLPPPPSPSPSPAAPAEDPDDVDTMSRGSSSLALPEVPSPHAAPLVALTAGALGDDVGAPRSQAVQQRRGTTLWQEYREVLWIAALGITAVVGSVFYRHTTLPQDAPQAALAIISAAPPTDPANAASPVTDAGSNSEPTRATTRELPRTLSHLDGPPTGPLPQRPAATTPATPNPSPRLPSPERPAGARGRPQPSLRMLSVVSTPSGAIVEVDGVDLGRTPLIKPRHNDVAALEITVRKRSFRTWRQTVTPNESGHFAVTANLEPLKR